MSAKGSGLDWSRQKILAEVNAKGMSLAELSACVGLGRTTLRNALNQDCYPRGERIIAEFIGVRPEIIWPTRYEQRAKRLKERQVAIELAEKIKTSLVA